MRIFCTFLLIFLSFCSYSQDDIQELDEIIIKSEVNLDKFLDSLFDLNQGKNQLIKYSNHKTVKFLNLLKVDEDTLLFLDNNFKFSLIEKTFLRDSLNYKNNSNFYLHKKQIFGDNTFVFKHNKEDLILPSNIFRKSYASNPLATLLYSLQSKRKNFLFFKENYEGNYKLFFKVKKDIGFNVEGYIIVDKINFFITKVEFKLNDNIETFITENHDNIKSKYKVLDYYGVLDLSECQLNKFCLDKAIIVSRFELLNNNDKKNPILNYKYKTIKSEVSDSLLVNKFDFKTYNKTSN